MPYWEAEELLNALACLETSPEPTNEELEGALLSFAGGIFCLPEAVASADTLLLYGPRSVLQF